MGDKLIRFPLRETETGLRLQGGDASGDERLATWLQASANLADALGIHVEISGKFRLHATHIRDLPTLADLTKPA